MSRLPFLVLSGYALTIGYALALGCGKAASSPTEGVTGCVTGCGTASAASTCSFSGPLPSPPDASLVDDYDPPSGVAVQTYAEAQGLAFLDAFVGSYLRGNTTVYTGTLSAHDNQSVLGADCVNDSGECANQAISEGPAVASLDQADGGETLSVNSLGAQQYVVFQQNSGAPGVTTVSIILRDGTSGGNSGTCTGCAPSFANKPHSIAIQNLTSTAYVAVTVIDAGPGVTDAGVILDAYAGAELNTYASTSLTLATPCDLTWNDLVALNSLSPPSSLGETTIANFVQQGNDMVAVMQGSAYSYSPDAESGCTTNYTLDLYVNLSNLADYGVRNYTVVDVDAGYYEPICPNPG
jgi:hypothetical protein